MIEKKLMKFIFTNVNLFFHLNSIIFNFYILLIDILLYKCMTKAN